MAFAVPPRQRGLAAPGTAKTRPHKEANVSPRKREPAPPDHATMLDLALEDLQRATIQGRELLQQHPDRAHEALDLLLFNIGCWEVRWLGLTNPPEDDEHAKDMELVDVDSLSTLDLGKVAAMSGRARELVASPGNPRSASHARAYHDQAGHAKREQMATNPGD